MSLSTKKILMCYHSADYGGVEQQILDIITGLSGEFEFYVACPNGPLVEEYLTAGAKKHLNLKPKFEADLGYALEIAGLVKKYHIDIVHAHELKTGSLAMFGAILGGAPKRIYHVHTPFSQWKQPSFKKYPALMINTIVNFIVGNFFATDVLALTPSIKRIRVRKEFILPSKIKVIPNGINLDLFVRQEEGAEEIARKYKIEKSYMGWDKFKDAPETPVIIGNISRFTSEKGHEILIRAFKLLLENEKVSKVHPIRLLLAGGGVLLPGIKKLADELGIMDMVTFTDKFPDEEKVKILSAIDLFVFPSYAEGFGIALLEAMAINPRLPIVASSLPVLKDVGEDAILYFATGDAKDLSNKMAEAISGRFKKDDPVLNPRVQASRFDLRKFWQNYSKLYNGF